MADYFYNFVHEKHKKHENLYRSHASDVIAVKFRVDMSLNNRLGCT